MDVNQKLAWIQRRLRRSCQITWYWKGIWTWRCTSHVDRHPQEPWRCSSGCGGRRTYWQTSSFHRRRQLVCRSPIWKTWAVFDPILPSFDTAPRTGTVPATWPSASACSSLTWDSNLDLWLCWEFLICQQPRHWRKLPEIGRVKVWWKACARDEMPFFSMNSLVNLQLRGKALS